VLLCLYAGFEVALFAMVLPVAVASALCAHLFYAQHDFMITSRSSGLSFMKDSRLVTNRDLKIVLALLTFPTVRRRNYFNIWLCPAFRPVGSHVVAKSFKVKIG